jgi:hypothetical protein
MSDQHESVLKSWQEQSEGRGQEKPYGPTFKNGFILVSQSYLHG